MQALHTKFSTGKMLRSAWMAVRRKLHCSVLWVRKCPLFHREIPCLLQTGRSRGLQHQSLRADFVEKILLIVGLIADSIHVLNWRFDDDGTEAGSASPK
jgi:hypothetical protein